MNIYSIEICLFTLLYIFKFEVDQLIFSNEIHVAYYYKEYIFFNYLFSFIYLRASHNKCVPYLY